MFDIAARGSWSTPTHTELPAPRRDTNWLPVSGFQLDAAVRLVARLRPGPLRLRR